jgi:uncharacterized SAM-binding protein YcdF (DUF218 family)
VSDIGRDRPGDVTERHTQPGPDATQSMQVAGASHAQALPPLEPSRTQNLHTGDASATQVLPAVDLSATQAMTVVADPTPVSGMPIPRRRRSPWRRRIVLGLLSLVVLGGAYYGITLYQVHSTGQSDQARPVDAIVVMGAAQYNTTGPSPQLAARLDHVVTLWERGIAPAVVTTGGNQPGDRFTEAEASKTYLVERGVPADAIVTENTSRNTYDAFRGVAELLPRGASVLIVTDPFHALRSRLTAEEVELDAYVSPTPTSVVVGNTARTKELKEAAGVALGRIIGFRRLLGITG